MNGWRSCSTASGGWSSIAYILMYQEQFPWRIACAMPSSWSWQRENWEWAYSFTVSGIQPGVTYDHLLVSNLHPWNVPHLEVPRGWFIKGTFGSILLHSALDQHYHETRHPGNRPGYLICGNTISVCPGLRFYVRGLPWNILGMRNLRWNYGFQATI